MLLKELRTSRKITQSQLAKICSVSRSTLTMWELGQSEPDIENICKLAQFFNVSTDYLLGVDPNPHYTQVSSSSDSFFSSEEIELVLAFRNATPEIRRIVNTSLEPYMRPRSVEQAI